MCKKCNKKLNKNNTIGICRGCVRVGKPKTECLEQDCSTLTQSKWGYCETHNQKGKWQAEKQAKAEWFARQPEENISDAVTRWAINNDVAERLFTNTEVQGDCLIWKGMTVDGYGRIGVGVSFGKGMGKYFSHPVLTHRLAYALSNDLPPSQHAPVNKTLVINHICRNRACVNASHLEVITQKENWEYAPRPTGPRNIDMSVKGTCLCGADFVGRKNKKWCSQKCMSKHFRMKKKQTV